MGMAQSLPAGGVSVTVTSSVFAVSPSRVSSKLIQSTRPVTVDSSASIVMASLLLAVPLTRSI